MTAQGLRSEEVRGAELLQSGERFATSPSFLARLISPGFRTIIRRIDQGLEQGSLLAHLPDGSTQMLGARGPGFDAEIWLKDWRALLRLATGGVIGFYQGFEAEEWKTPDMVALLALMSANVRTLGNIARSTGPLKWAAKLVHRFNRNSREGSLRNIAAHYDLGNDFYRSWLDPMMAYSSGLGVGHDGLESAQQRKFGALSARLGEPQSVLEIGCGWGSLAEHIANGGAQITAISLSVEQLGFARAQASPNVDFRKLDYRDVTGQYDAVVSCEMVEALGREYWPDFMDCVARSLKPGGRAAIQYISIADDLFDAYADTVDFIQAYIFPGGMLIRTSEFRALAEERGLQWQDQMDFGLDYAETLQLWHANFDTALRENRLPSGFDARFIRLWKFYLDYCEAGFRAGNIDVHQVTLTKS
jgi:cyclopropane-fatty-acyl-phospholipid synthase